MKMGRFFLMLMLCLAGKGQAQNFITSGGANEEDDRFILSNLVNAQPHEGRWIGGEHPKRAVSFFTGDWRYGVKYRVDYVVIHYNESNPAFGTSSHAHRWGKPRIYTNTETGSSKPDKRISHFNHFEKRRWKDAPWNNSDIVRQDAGNLRLESNTNYWMTFDTSYHGDYLKHDYQILNKFFPAENNNEYSSQRWNIANQEMILPSGERDDPGGWRWPSSTSSPPLQFALKVRETHPDPWEIGDTITPGNLEYKNWIRPVAQHDVWIRRQKEVGNEKWWAINFVTSVVKDSPPLAFRVNHVTMLNPIRNRHDYVMGTHFIAIYDDGGFTNRGYVPGREIGRFSDDLPEIIEGSFPGQLTRDNRQQHRFHADPDKPILLKPFQTYWLVQGMENAGRGTVRWGIHSFTRFKDEEGWPIGGIIRRTDDGGNSWRVHREPSPNDDRTMRFGFDVTIIDPHEATGDFNVDGNVNVLDLIILNDHLSGAHLIPTQSVYFDIGNLNGPFGSIVIDGDDRDAMLNMILQR